MHIAVELTHRVGIIVAQSLNKKVYALDIITIVGLSNLMEKNNTKLCARYNLQKAAKIQ